MNGASSACAGVEVEQLHVAQPLPVEVFVDPYQLSNLAAGAWFNFTAFGPLDLESPAPECEPTLAGIRVDVRAWKQTTSNDGGGPTALALPSTALLRVFMPLHSRYPAPTPESGEAKYAGHWWSTLASGSKVVELPPPVVVAQCATPPLKDQDQEDLVCQLLVTQTPGDAPVRWEVPAGSLPHQGTVALFTIITATVACAIVLAVLFRD